MTERLGSRRDIVKDIATVRKVPDPESESTPDTGRSPLTDLGEVALVNGEPLIEWDEPDPQLAWGHVVLEPFTGSDEKYEDLRDRLITFKDSESGFELTMTGSFYGLIKNKYGGANRMKQVFTDMRAAVLGDPFGDHNIDEFVDTDAGQWARVVQKLPDDSPLADLVPGKQLAVKTTGMDMESTRKYLEFRAGRRSKLVDQFRSTRRLVEVMKEVVPDGFLDGLVGVVEVYAVLREPKQEGDYEPREWMLMEHIAGARSIEDRSLVLSRGGTVPGFDTAKYPELTEAFKKKAPFIASMGLLVLRIWFSMASWINMGILTLRMTLSSRASVI